MEIVDIYFTSAITHDAIRLNADASDWQTVVEYALDADCWQALDDATYDATHRCTVCDHNLGVGVYTVFAREREETEMEVWLREGREEMLEYERSTLPM